jgi:hypothetical protein
MNLITFPESNKVAETGLYQPAISIILPFDCTHQKNPNCKYSHIHNAIDNIIETVLENGGDIESVENGSLDNYEHIVLLQY